MNSALHIAAQDYAKRHMPVLACGTGAKTPATAHGVNDATCELATIDALWSLEDYNIGIALEGAGLCALDLDGPDAEDVWFMLQVENGFAPDTYEVKTPNGRHLYFKGSLPPTVSKLGARIDTRGRGSYVLAPPSIVKGKTYEATNSLEPAALPEWIAGLLIKPERVKSSAPTASGRPVSAALVEGMLRCIDPACDRNQWLTICGGLVNAPVTDATWDGLSTFARWSGGEWHGGSPTNFKGADDCEAQWARDVEQRVDGEGVPAFGALVNLAREHGYDGPSHTIPPACERIAREALDRLLADSVPSAQGETALSVTSGGWSFGVHDAEADATLPPITYRDALKLWPDSPGKTVSQVIAGAKRHKTNLIMAELFRLMLHAGAKVLMLALEGGYGVRTMRLKALAAYYNVPLSDLRGRFQVDNITEGGMFDMSDSVCVATFADFVKAGGWTDVFIDTQHRSAGALEENSATDARLFWNAVEVLRRRGNVNVTLTHHTGKDATKGGRGSSADLASVDQQIELSFDRVNMTVTAKVTARKDGVDGFSVPFKVEQENENAVPVLVPMSAKEFQELADSEDMTAPHAVAAALQSMECVGKPKHCTSTVIATEILSLHGQLPQDPEDRQRTVKNLVNRLQTRAQKDARLQAYGRKDGAGRTAPWLWYLPNQDREGWPNV